MHTDNLGGGYEGIPAFKGLNMVHKRLCYGGISLVTDYDTGVEGDLERAPVTQEEVFVAFAANLTTLRDVLLAALVAIPTERTCVCAEAPAGNVPVPPDTPLG